MAMRGRRRRDPRRRAQAGAGLRVQPVRGGQDQHQRRRERRRRGDRQRRAAHAGAVHRQGGQPRQPLRRHQAGAEKIITQGNAYAGDAPARFATMRYGNVVGSRGSVIPLFKAQAREGELTITDEAMTRFWITLEQAVEFVISCLELMQRRRGVRPAHPQHAGLDIADAIAPHATRRIIGIRPGEKVHEVLITEDESRHARALAGPLRDLPAVALVGHGRRAARRGAAAGLSLFERQPTTRWLDARGRSARWPSRSSRWREGLSARRDAAGRGSRGDPGQHASCSTDAR